MLGSCTANAIGGAKEFDRLKQQPTDFVPSRLFIYYNERVIEGTVQSDSGAQIRDRIKSVSQGVWPESEWPCDITKFTQKPPAQAYTDATFDRAASYQSFVQDVNQMKGCLASDYPFVFGFTVYEGFEVSTVEQNAMHRCRLQASGPSAVTRCWPWAMRTRTSGSSCGTRGEPLGVWRTTSRCRPQTSSSPGWRRTSGRSASSDPDLQV